MGHHAKTRVCWTYKAFIQQWVACTIGNATYAGEPEYAGASDTRGVTHADGNGGEATATATAANAVARARARLALNREPRASLKRWPLGGLASKLGLCRCSFIKHLFIILSIHQ